MKKKILEKSYGLRNILSSFFVISVVFAITLDMGVILSILQYPLAIANILNYSIIMAFICTYIAIYLGQNLYFSYFNYIINNKYLYLRYNNGIMGRFSWSQIKNIGTKLNDGTITIELEYSKKMLFACPLLILLNKFHNQKCQDELINQKIKIHINDVPNETKFLLDLHSNKIHQKNVRRKNIPTYSIKSSSLKNIFHYVLLIVTLIIGIML